MEEDNRKRDTFSRTKGRWIFFLSIFPTHTKRSTLALECDGPTSNVARVSLDSGWWDFPFGEKR